MKLNIREAIGFTLIELLIAVAIVGILAAVAYPNYYKSMVTSRRVDGINSLLAIQMEQEKYRANNPTYAANLSSLSHYSADSIDSPDGYYTLTVTAADASSFTATATAKAGTSQVDDTGCTTLTINQNGPVGGTSCWNK